MGMSMAKTRSDILKNFMSKFAGRSVFIVGSGGTILRGERE